MKKALIILSLFVLFISCKQAQSSSSVLEKQPIASIENLKLDGKAVINNQNSPNIKLKSIDIGDCKWTHGFWADKWKHAEDVMIPHMGTLLKGDIGHAYNNFKIAAGLKEGRHKGWWWHDGDFYKWMEACMYLYGVNKDQKILNELDEIIDVIKQAQQDNGYLSTPAIINKDIQPFSNRKYHELYNSGHLLTAACIHHRVSGKTNFLEIAVKHANLLYDLFAPQPDHLKHFGFNQTQIMGLVELYRTTKDKRYLALAEIFINMRGNNKLEIDKTTKGYPVGDMVQERTPLRASNEAVGHAVLALYYYAGAADIYAETGEEALIEALDRLWGNVVNQKMYVTGAVGQAHYGRSTSKDNIEEGFINEYMMPNLTAYNETCANICNSMFNNRMLGIHGEAKYADVMELVLYNSALSGISLDGKHYYYTNPLRKIDGAIDYNKMNTEHSERQPYLNCFCCPPNLVRTIAKSPAWAYSKTNNGVSVNLYGGNQLETTLLDGTALKLSQKTLYPWEGHVEITIEDCKSEPFEILLRIPDWAKGANVKINDEMVDTPIQTQSFLKLQRKWKKGDVISLNLPLDIHFVEGNPRIEETRNQVALKRGPVVYCLESSDLPNDASILDAYISQKSNLKASYNSDFLGGVTTLEGPIMLRSQQKEAMYNTLGNINWREAKSRFIPYYAWSNRGPSEMTVFLPIILN